MLARWKELASLEPKGRRRSEYGALALIFANLARGLDVWKQALEGWNVEECEIVREWEEQGRQRGLQQGRQEGQLESLRKVLLHVFEQRFPGAVPADLAAAAQSQTDVDTLMRWMDLLLTAASPEQLRAALGS